MEERIVTPLVTQSQVVGEKECVDEIVATVSRQSGAWKKVKLGGVAETALGKMLDKVKNQGEYYPYLANVDVRWGEFDLSNLSQMRFQESEIERYSVKYNDLIICEGGETGRCALWKHNTPMLYQKALHRVRSKDKNVLNIEYLYYWFLLAGKLNLIDQYTTGATIKHLPAIKLNSVLIDLPPRSVQDSIATTLSRYDALIANYQRQIKLLEEAAQRLYKEWFVDLHFPGHENVKVTDGVPEGWEKKKLGDVATFKRGKTITKGNVKVGNIPVVAGGLNPAYFHDTANTKAPVVTVSGSGANAGFTRLYYTDVWASDCSYIDSRTTENIYFVYCFLKTNNVSLDNLQKGSAQPHVYAKDINKMPIMKPSHDTLHVFNKIVRSYFNKIANMDTQLTLLTESRDRLLPKLMSGEIEI